MKTVNLLLTLLFFLPASATEEERVFKVFNAASGLADNSAQIVKCTKTGRMIISTIGNLNFFDGNGFTHADTRQDLQYPLQVYRGHYHLYFDHYHHIWLKNKFSVTCLDLMTEKYVQNVDSVIKTLGCHDQVLDMFTDSVGRPWFLTSNGLQSPDMKTVFKVQHDLNLQDMEVKGNLLLLFYESGEEVGLDTLTGAVAHRTRAYGHELAEKYNASSVLESYGDGFFQIRNGYDGAILMHFDVPTQQWTTIFEVPYHLNNMTVHDGRLYLPSEYGYWVYDPKTKEKEHVEALTMKDGQKLQTDCNTLAFDLQGGMWIGTERRGVLYARPFSHLFTTYTWDQPEAGHYSEMMASLDQNIEEFRGQKAYCKYIDSRGWEWIGTTMGLVLRHNAADEGRRITTRDGLNNNVIHAIVEDEENHLWVSTSCGISFIEIKDGHIGFINSFTEDDNVPNESFVNGKAMRLDDGTIIMQALDHVVTFHPRDMETVNKSHPFMTYPKLTRIMVNGDIVEPGVPIDGEIVIDRAVVRVRDIYLQSRHTTISLTFTGLNYFRPHQTFYRFRVKGIIDDWMICSFHGSDLVDSKGLLHLPLVGLRPGDYEVELQSSMFPDEWTNKPFKWVIHVKQPWWQTTGVFIIVGLVLLSLILVNFLLYNRNSRMRERRNAEEGDMIRKVSYFAERCASYSTATIEPRPDNLSMARNESHNQLSPQFIDVMTRLMPHLGQEHRHFLSVRRLSELGGVDIVQFYEIMTANLYKDPQDLARLMRLNKGAELLRTTNMTVEQIATECGYYTPNYFIGSFFHQFRQTPLEYRKEQLS